jgi:CHAD domain-containing protein
MSVFVLPTGTSQQKVLSRVYEKFPIKVQDDPGEILTYSDTFDWRLFRAGFTLAVARAGNTRRVELRERDGQVVRGRLNRDLRFASTLPEGPLRDRMEPLTAPRRLLDLARCQWAGTLVAILDADRKTVARLRFREGPAMALPGGEPVDVSPRLECLHLKGYEAEAKEVQTFLIEQLGLTPDPRTEAEAVFEAVGIRPEDYSSSFTLELNPEWPAAASARAIHRELLHTLQANREGVLKDWDIEFLHDFRVAIRRTRSALSQIKDVFPETQVAHFSQEFRWLASRTGPVRDIDVYLMKIPALRDSLRPEARSDLEPMVQLLREKKRRELRRLRTCLRSRRFQLLMEEWEAFLQDPGHSGKPGDPPTSGDAAEPGDPEAGGSPVPALAGRPIKEVASARIRSAFEKVMKKGQAVRKDTNPEALHRLRIDCKKLRYLLTFFRSLYPEDEIKPLIKALKRLQDRLGDFNDLQVQSETLSHLAEELMAAERGPPATLLAMGQLMGQMEGAQAKELEAFQEYFERFSRKKDRKRFKRLFSGGSSGDSSPGDSSPGKEQEAT